MRLELQVCTADQARRLKELGVAQNSFFGITQEGNIISKHSQGLALYAIATETNAAFTVAELGQMLPEYVDKGSRTFRRVQWSNRPSDGNPLVHAEEYRLAYRQSSEDCFGEFPDNFHFSTEAQIRAAVLIHLLETKLIQVEDVNQRLK